MFPPSSGTYLNESYCRELCSSESLSSEILLTVVFETGSGNDGPVTLFTILILVFLVSNYCCDYADII